MRHRFWVTMISIAFALLGGTRAFARSVRHDRHSRAHTRVSYHRSRVSVERLSRRHGRIIGSRRTHVYYVMAYRSRWPAPRDRVYFQTTAAARAAGYRPGGRAPIPVPHSLTWQGTKRQLPSIGTQHVPPPPPKSIQKPLAPPAAQQPEVTPTNPTPN